jgi:hypothetical protein
MAEYTDKTFLAEELPYLQNMLLSGGTREVPSASMPGYLRLQEGSARHAGLYGLAAVLEDCADVLDRGAPHAAAYAYKMLASYIAGLKA